VKLKARDIVPGWPKGRSTSHVYGFGFRSLAMRIRDTQNEDDITYHQRQQAMVDQYRKLEVAHARDLYPKDLFE
jgi:hypothetical protein